MNWKKALIFSSPLLCLFFTACGGGGGSTPPPQPPTMSTPNDQAALKDLYDQAIRMKQVCSTEYAEPFKQIAQQYVATQASYLQGMPMTAASANPQTMIYPAVPYQPQAIPTGQQCNQEVKNLLLSCMTIKESNGGKMYCERPEAQQWLVAQVADVINRVAATIQTGSNINILANKPLQSALLSQVAYTGQQQIIPSLGSIAPQVSSVASGYFAGLPF